MTWENTDLLQLTAFGKIHCVVLDLKEETSLTLLLDEGKKSSFIPSVTVETE